MKVVLAPPPFVDDTRFSGTGVVVVNSGPSGNLYDAWANGTFVPALTHKLPGDNQDNDSLTNLQEFAFGTQPTVSTGEIAYVLNGSVTPGAPKIFPNVPANGMYSMVFGRRADYVAAGLTYTVEFSANLSTWADNNDASNPPVQVATDGTVNAMSVPFPDFITTTSGTQKPTFSRVKVVLQPVVIMSNNFDAWPIGDYTTAMAREDWNTPTSYTGIAEGRAKIVGGSGSNAYKNKALQILLPAGKIGSTGSGVIVNSPLGASYNDVMLSYRIRFADNFQFNLTENAGKALGLGGGSTNVGGGIPADGTNGWSARLSWLTGGEAMQYVYHTDQPGNFGQSFRFRGVPNPTRYSPGVWHKIETRVVMNTPGMNNGILQSRVDGVLIVDERTMNFRNTSNFAIDHIKLHCFMGGGTIDFAPTVDTSVMFDEIEVRVSGFPDPIDPLPSPFVNADIGNPGVAGSATQNAGTFTISASGTDIWGTSDQFHFVSQPAYGNCEIVAQVLTVQPTDAWAKTGVMIRESMLANSMNAGVYVTPNNGITFQWRTLNGGTSVFTQQSGLVAPYWVKLVRGDGNKFTASYSSNGTSWTQLGTAQTILMASTTRIGLASSSHANTVLGTNTIKNVIVKP